MDTSQVARGNETLQGIQSVYEDDGFTAQFGVATNDGVDVADVMCYSCHQRSPASAIALEAMTRVEGASDPDEMAAVAAVTCPRCNARGTLTLMFGPNASVEESEVMRFLEDDRRARDGGTNPLS